jgi:hypothetical protein
MKYVFLLFATFSTSISWAQIVEEIPISFGTIALVHNDSVGSLSIDIFDNLSVDNNFRVITPGNFGVFNISGLPANSALPVQVNITNSTMNPGRAFDESFTFSVSSYDQTARADASGNATIRVGGTITTSGTGNRNFEQATYESQIRITINF